MLDFFSAAFVPSEQKSAIENVYGLKRPTMSMRLKLHGQLDTMSSLKFASI